MRARSPVPCWISAALAAALAAGPALARGPADGDVAGRFDYYVLALSWSPTWCETTGAARDAPQCDPGQRTGFVVHGLWPQYERGWPDDCPTGERDPSRRDSQAMADVMGSSSLAWYQWQKHGRCSGLSAGAYYQAIRDAAAAAPVPEPFTRLDRDIRLSAEVIEEAFIAANPALTRAGVTVTCDGARLDEVRICLTRDLEPRPCAPDTRADCRRPMLMQAPR